jgi:hypothetical protein
LLRRLVPGKTISYTASPANSSPGGVYDVRGLKLNDNDLSEARDILFAEVSNRGGDRRSFEVENVMNVAVNRALAKKKTLTEVLQEPNQFQGYAPQGVTVKGGEVVDSQYQKIKKGDLNELDKRKLKEIETALQSFKTGKFKDRTGGAQFYVHASDGTMWFGETVEQAKERALEHEAKTGAHSSQFGTSVGLPAGM